MPPDTATDTAATPDLQAAFADWPALIAGHAAARPAAPALVCGDECLTWRELDARADRIAAALQRDGFAPQDTIAICATASIGYVALFVGALRAGITVAPIAPGATPTQREAMVADSGAKRCFDDAAITALDGWLADAPARPRPVAIEPGWAFNIIYSSGTTGTPKGIVQPHAMRWAHIRRAAGGGYGPDTIALLSTPLYSNTTLVVLIPTLAFGGRVVLMPKFDALGWLELAERHRVTHTMLVPVQYRRILQHPAFDRFDLSSFRFKACTSAPFAAELKAEVLRRWPGALADYYGLTEGGGTCILRADLYPHKLHTVGRPAEGHDIRLVDDEGRELPPGPDTVGEIVGRSPGMMSGYHRQPAKTREAEWFDAEGRRYIRTGDVGRFDEDGFLVLMDRKKDMIISGGFNVYPSDLEAVLRTHEAVADVAVVGVPSEQWGETPVAFVVLRPGVADASADATADALREWGNARVGKTQRLAALHLIEELPRSAIGKVLKRELRERCTGA